jgi:hypothetical protein
MHRCVPTARVITQTRHRYVMLALLGLLWYLPEFISTDYVGLQRIGLHYGRSLSVLKWFDVCRAVTRLNFGIPKDLIFFFYCQVFFPFHTTQLIRPYGRCCCFIHRLKVKQKVKGLSDSVVFCACHNGVWGLLTSALGGGERSTSQLARFTSGKEPTIPIE